MNYAALIQNRKSFREFTDKQVPVSVLREINDFYASNVHRLIPQLKTELCFFGTDTRAALEGAAGYNQFLIGAPQYLVLLSDKHPQAHLNAGFVMQDLLLKLEDLGLNSCWLTFADSEEMKEALGVESELDVAAVAAFGYGKKTVKRLRLNIRTMSDVDVVEQYRYMDPKRSVRELIWGSSRDAERRLGFYDDMLWESLYAASLAPSYLNRQAYGFVIHPAGISLVSRPDEYNVPIDGELSLGIVLHHVASGAETWLGKIIWRFGKATADLEWPEGHAVVATCAL